ncbi:hypothetical protein FOYG_08896 [Fusarium oxysporum NRRL 32931]|uniref:Uncharacterized protein n=1 Tax=Fusarium oxysporum NRRL 32931 TaxID=660029 RepID=W9IAQ5_FUSOX|nr:hypothetical protein FOYG_08896 [Fusarium oxysporum NRRL 32931]
MKKVTESPFPSLSALQGCSGNDMICLNSKWRPNHEQQIPTTVHSQEGFWDLSLNLRVGATALHTTAL